MASSGRALQLDPPQRRRWVKFGDWDEEAMEFRPSADNPIPMSVSNPSISSSMASVSSVTFSSNSEIASSLSSDSLDCPEIFRRMSVLDQSTNRPPVEFNASFGGTALNGDVAGLRASWLNPNQLKSIERNIMSPSFYFDESEMSSSYSSSSVDDKNLRYSAFAELEENKDFSLGWSRSLRGEECKDGEQVLIILFIIFSSSILA